MKMVRLFFLVCVASQSVTFANGMRPLPPVVCDWKTVPVESGDEPKIAAFTSEDEFCYKNEKKFELMIDNCLTGPNALEQNPVFIARLRLEQLKLVFTEDLLATSRVAPDLKYFESTWKSFKDRWSKIAAQEAELLNRIDTDPNRVANPCKMSALLGKECGHIQAEDVFTLYQEKSIQGYENKSVGRVIPPGLTYDLIKSELMTRTYHTPIENLLIHGANEDKKEVQEREIDLERRISKDTIMGNWPELRANTELRGNLRFLIEQRGLTKKVIAATAEIEKPKGTDANGAPATHSERDQIVDNIMKNEFQGGKIVREEFISQVEKNFQFGHKLIIRSMGEHLRLGKIDKGWLLEQQYLLEALKEDVLKQNKLRHSEKLNEQASKIQTQMCANIFHVKKVEKVKKIGGEVLTVAAIATGAGGMAMGFFEVGSMAVARYLGQAAGTLILAAGGFEVLDLYSSFIIKRDLFAIREAKDSEVAYAHNDYTASIPMAAINFALIGPTFLLKTGRLLAWVDKANFGMGAYMAKAGYEGVEGVISNTKEKRLAARKRAQERMAIREKITRERTDVD